MLLRHPHAAPRNALQRKMAGREPSSEDGSRQQRAQRPAAESGGVLGHAPARRLGTARREGAAAPPSPLPPPRQRRGQNPGPAPRALAGDFGRRQREERGRALTRAESGPAFERPCRGPHPGPQGHLLSRPRSLGCTQGSPRARADESP